SVWYSQSVNWAAENQIVNGVSDGTFAPDSSITREQLAVILYRYAMYKGYDIAAKDKSDISAFSDSEKISSYAADAISYVTAIGVMNGRGENTIAPSELVTRAEVATMLMRFAEIKG
ncbi:MAG: S-layer homology domain-containing protein, partial [Clostridia bacterium]|nr:S-layer homology domain-containing protein [Clostridia bacterium]